VAEHTGSETEMSLMDPPQVVLSVIMPCLNEAETLAACIRKAHVGCQQVGMKYEIVIADNGSTDGSQAIAQAEGARIVDVPIRGYGAALKAGIQAACGRFVIMGDSDGSYDFSQIAPFVECWQKGYQLVMGSRFRGDIKPGAMPFLHQWIGNPLLTGIGNLFFHCGLSDYHCGLRGFDREAILSLHLFTSGMEFASEMVIKSTLERLKIAEIPIIYWPDGRSRSPHLHTWRDGWRHLRFMLLYSPRWLFLYPGIALSLLGLVIMLALLPGPQTIGSVTFDVHTLLAGSFMLLVGVQLILLAVFARMFAFRTGLLPQKPAFYELIRRASLETGVVVGALTVTLGLLVYLYTAWLWSQTGFGPLNYEVTLRTMIPGSALIGVGVEVLFASFLISLLELG